MDKNKKQKNRDSPHIFEPKNFHQGSKRAMLIVDIKYKNNRDSPPRFELGKKFPGFEMRHVDGKHKCILKPEEFFFGSNLGENPYFFVFYVCPSTWRILKPGEFSPSSYRGGEFIFFFVLYVCHHHSAFSTLRNFFGFKNRRGTPIFVGF